MRMRFAPVAAIFILAMTLLPTTADSDTIFSQPYVGPPHTAGFVSDAPTQIVADDFTLLSTSLLTDFHWWGGYTNTPPGVGVPPDAWTLTIYPDLGSLQSLSGGTDAFFTNLVRMPTGDITPSGNAVFAYTADFVTPVTLGPGMYYALLVGDGATSQLAGWTATGPSMGSPAWFRASGGAWGRTDRDQAFEITGQAIPEPVTFLLLGTGLSVVAARRRLQKRA